MDAFSMLTVFSESHRLHHGTELKDGVLKPSFEQPSRCLLYTSDAADE